MTRAEVVICAIEGAKSLPDGALRSRSRDPRVAEARRECMRVMRDVLGLSSAEIAKALNRDPGNVRATMLGLERRAA